MNRQAILDGSMRRASLARLLRRANERGGDRADGGRVGGHSGHNVGERVGGQHGDGEGAVEQRGVGAGGSGNGDGGGRNGSEPVGGVSNSRDSAAAGDAHDIGRGLHGGEFGIQSGLERAKGGDVVGTKGWRGGSAGSESGEDQVKGGVGFGEEQGDLSVHDFNLEVHQDEPVVDYFLEFDLPGQTFPSALFGSVRTGV